MTLKLVFTSSDERDPAFNFLQDSLLKINGAFEYVTIEVHNDPNLVDYSNYEAALFFKYDEHAAYAKSKNPSLITGVIDPRAAQEQGFRDVDFIAVHDIVAKDYFSKFSCDILVHYIYPKVPEKLDCPIEKKQLVLGYHGNMIHMEAMVPRITQAIAVLGREIPLELWAMYNIEKRGQWQSPSHKNLGFSVKHIQYSSENYARYMAHVDIGLVPQLIPVRKNRLLRYLIGTLDHRYMEKSKDYLLRFKETTNIGRHLVFAQYKIPVVSDMSPAACALIEEGMDGFVAFHTQSWYRALQSLAVSSDLRDKMGKRLYEKYKKKYTHEKLNEELITLINKLAFKGEKYK